MRQGYWTASTVCERYGGMSKKTLSRFIENKNFPRPVFGGKGRESLFDIESVLQWENQYFDLPYKNHIYKQAS